MMIQAILAVRISLIKSLKINKDLLKIAKKIKINIEKILKDKHKKNLYHLLLKLGICHMKVNLKHLKYYNTTRS